MRWHGFRYSSGVWWISAAVFIAIVACEKKDAVVPPGDVPPPAASPASPQTLTQDPALAKAVDDIVQYRMRVEKDPTDVEAMVALGNANLMLRRYDHAKDWYERALKVDPNRTGTRMDLAIALRYLKQPDDAIAQLNRVLATEPKNAAALYNLGVILLEDKNDEKQAIAKWQALINAHPDHPQTPQLQQMVERLKQPKTDAPTAAAQAPAGG